MSEYVSSDQRDDKIRQLERRVGELETALRQIWEYPNAEHHHVAEECELRAAVPEDEEPICTCGYWSMSFPEFKLIARDALEYRGDDD